MDILSFIRNAPKAELHTHIDGALRVETVIELAKKQHINLPTYELDALKKLLTNDENCKSLIEYFKPFEYTISVMQTQESLERVMYEFLEDSFNDNIRYSEARFCPSLHTNNGLSLKQIMNATIKGKEQAERDFNIKSNLIVCGLRQFDTQSNIELAQLAIDYKNKGVVAFDLAGEELNRPAKNHIKAFELATKNNLYRTVHAGEADGAHSIADAIHYLNAQRIGHGTNLFQDTDLLNYVADRQIGLEICLSSNMQTKSVSDITKHPIKEYLNQHIAVTLNTDSTLISGTTLSKEFELAVKLFNFTPHEIEKIMTTGFQQAFLNIDEKEDLLAEIKRKYKLLLNN
ncbi:MAG: adenosine deaminase [Bacteroidales bacterium]|nr:adenosine deaminase [Bacteroidales bacterium]